MRVHVGGDEVLQRIIVGFAFRATGMAQAFQRCAGAGDFLAGAGTAADQEFQQHAEPHLAQLRRHDMALGDMGGLVGQHAGQLVRAFHLVDQLVGDQDAAAGQGKGVGEAGIDDAQAKLEGRAGDGMEPGAQAVERRPGFLAGFAFVGEPGDHLVGLLAHAAFHIQRHGVGEGARQERQADKQEGQAGDGNAGERRAQDQRAAPRPAGREEPREPGAQHIPVAGRDPQPGIGPLFADDGGTVRPVGQATEFRDRPAHGDALAVEGEGVCIERHRYSVKTGALAVGIGAGQGRAGGCVGTR